jgi:hypothetical protein
MDFIKRMLASIFNKDFLVKILLIVGIFFLLKLHNNGIRLDINLDIRTYGAELDLTLKNEK